MAVSVTPSDAPASSQYDPDSAPNQNYNCGPTTVVNAVRYHRDIEFPIEATRDLATSRNYTGTNISERKIMFDKRGVPASVRHLSPTELKKLLNGRRAFDIALKMSEIPLAIRVRPFPGAHSVEGVAVASAVCPIHKVVETGIIVNNPDFHRGRGERARYFYPDHAWIPAYLALGGWCVVPDKDKVIPTRTSYRRSCRTTARVNARSGPGTNFSLVKTLPTGYAFTSIQLETAGGAYVANGRTRRDWLSFSLSGRLVWVARAYVREV